MVERREFGMEVMAKEVEVAVVRVVPPLKMLVLEKVLAVVVEKAVVKTPVDELYESGKIAESDVLEILLLNEVQSVLVRKPLVEPLDWESVRVLPESESGPE